MREILNTRRLSLREMTEDDLGDLREILQDPREQEPGHSAERARSGMFGNGATGVHHLRNGVQATADTADLFDQVKQQRHSQSKQ